MRSTARQAHELFNVAIQAGAILAALVVFWPRISQLLLGMSSHENVTISPSWFSVPDQRRGRFAAKQLAVTLPETWPVAGALLVGGLLILLIEWRVSGRPLVTSLAGQSPSGWARRRSSPRFPGHLALCGHNLCPMLAA